MGLLANRSSSQTRNPHPFRCSQCQSDNRYKQAGTGPSRRHIYGSKIAKDFKKSKYSLLQYIKNPKSWTGLSLARTPGALKCGISLSDFWTSIVAKHQQIEGRTLWGTFVRKKSNNDEKTERGYPLVSPGIVCYAEKEEKSSVSLR